MGDRAGRPTGRRCFRTPCGSIHLGADGTAPSGRPQIARCCPRRLARETGPAHISTVLGLRCATDPQWVQTVLNDLDAFLLDHASNERKASALAMSLVAHYPDRDVLVREMIQVAQEELEHFRRVFEIIDARGLVLAADIRDPYVRALLEQLRKGRDPYFLDRLLVAGVVEARGCERFGLLGEALPPGELKDFYQDIARSEARHHGLFLRLARTYFPGRTSRGAS